MTQDLLAATPFLCKERQIDPAWIDYNGHLNMAYYNVIFDTSGDEFFHGLGIGANYLKERNGSTMTAEAHVRYLREVHLGDPLQVSIFLIGTDAKRLHLFKELRHAKDGWLSATSETMTLHVDMSVRKVAPFPDDIQETMRKVAAAHAQVPRPEGIGRAIGMPAKK